MTSGLRHAAHPFQFCTIQIVGSCNLRPAIVYALLTFLQIIAVVATIGIDGLIIQFQDDRADPIEEETVMRHHQKCLVTTIQESLQPFNHLQIQMVRGLIENQKVGISNQHVCQSHSFLLPTTQLSHGLLQVTNLQLRQDLFGLQHLFLFTLMIKAGIQHTFRRIEDWTLFQHPYSQIASEDDLT